MLENLHLQQISLALKIGCKVGLLDADIYGPSIPKMFNIDEKPKSDGQLDPITNMIFNVCL